MDEKGKALGVSSSSFLAGEIIRNCLECNTSFLKVLSVVSPISYDSE